MALSFVFFAKPTGVKFSAFLSVLSQDHWSIKDDSSITFVPEWEYKCKTLQHLHFQNLVDILILSILQLMLCKLASVQEYH